MPRVRKTCSSTVVSTRVFSNTASGWKTARKRRATRSKIRRSSSLSFDGSCVEFVGMIAWWSPTFASSTTRAERQQVEAR